jgi:hypothetical protein
MPTIMLCISRCGSSVLAKLRCGYRTEGLDRVTVAGSANKNRLRFERLHKMQEDISHNFEDR